MKRLRILLMVLLLSAVIVATVAFGSPYAPVMQPVAEIEEIWAIEDTRQESEIPLVMRLLNHGAELGYDESENTFYCTLGMDNGETWPQLHLTAPEAKGVSLVFVDDYTYDWCADAIRDGYAYQFIAYTDKEFSYSQIVFTGLPIISLTADAEIPPHTDVPTEIAVSWAGEAPFFSPGRAHKRGATSLNKTPKNGIKVEFTRGENGGKTFVDAPFFGMTEDLTLIACSIDPLMIRDRLSWDMYNRFVQEDEPFGDLETRYGELFVNDDYHGVYLMMDAYDYEQEIALENMDAPLSDTYYRTVDGVIENPERPVIMDHLGHSYEQHYAPQGETDFQSIRPYLDMIAEQDDAQFSRKVLERMDLDSVIRYALFIEACGMIDNEFNNLGIWAHYEEKGIRYGFVPWDLDVSWGLDDDRNAEIWYSFDLFNRMLRLDCGGIVRARTQEIWHEMRTSAFHEQNMDELMARYEKALNDSGAFYRNAIRWERQYETLDTYDIYAYALSRFEMMDRRVEELASDELKDRQIWMDHYEIQDLGELDDRLRGLEQ